MCGLALSTHPEVTFVLLGHFSHGDPVHKATPNSLVVPPLYPALDVHTITWKILFSFLNASLTQHHFLSRCLFHRHTCSSNDSEQEDSLVNISGLPTAIKNIELGLGRKKDATSPHEEVTQARGGTLYSITSLSLDRIRRLVPGCCKNDHSS